MTPLWMCLMIGTAVLAAFMLFNGSWRRHPALFSYLAIVVGQSVACWWLWDSHAYFYAYYAGQIAGQIAQICIIIELAVQVTAADAETARLIRHAVPALACLAFGITGAMAFAEPVPATQRLVYFASHLDTAISLAWAMTFIAGLLITRFGGFQLSGSSRGIACGFLLEILTSNVLSFMYAHNPKVVETTTLNAVSYGVTLTIWAAALLPLRAPAFPPAQVYVSAKRGFTGQ